MAFSNQMVDALTFIEQRFWEDGVIPTNEIVAQETGIRLDTIKEYWKNEDFRTALMTRGVNFDNRPDNKTLTYEQLMMANALMNIHDPRTTRQKCKELNISPQKLNAWMRQPAFQEHLKRRAETMLSQATPSAHRSLVRLIDEGDLKAIQLFYEMQGIYNPRVSVDVNVTVVLAKVVEIVSKHVKDPAILTAIADEIEGLELGTQAIPAKAGSLDLQI